MRGTKIMVSDDTKVLSSKMKVFLSEMINENMDLISENFRKLEPNQMMNALAKILPYIALKVERPSKEERRESSVERGDVDVVGDDVYCRDEGNDDANDGSGDDGDDGSNDSDDGGNDGNGSGDGSGNGDGNGGGNGGGDGNGDGSNDGGYGNGNDGGIGGRCREKVRMSSVAQLKEMLARRGKKAEGPFYKQFDIRRKRT